MYIDTTPWCWRFFSANIMIKALTEHVFSSNFLLKMTKNLILITFDAWKYPIFFYYWKLDANIKGTAQCHTGTQPGASPRYDTLRTTIHHIIPPLYLITNNIPFFETFDTAVSPLSPYGAVPDCMLWRDTACGQTSQQLSISVWRYYNLLYLSCMLRIVSGVNNVVCAITMPVAVSSIPLWQRCPVQSNFPESVTCNVKSPFLH